MSEGISTVYLIIENKNCATALAGHRAAIWFNKNLGIDVILKDGTEAIKIQTGTGKNKTGGYWTKDGKLVTFWDCE